ncbi:hypothetical protein A8F94_12830 [Bacillus sp. FJAT-27225]|uniref:DUF2628 domain-containing protein n=1 Tax=Bacillus sp. FJAT-27225 TaxID=1743144 RepID=UPI00080C2713|nr:DUF2628 domain-containing protein [Bacillus sp. FJAT-27225]OCA85751.1 hypothetical protein A8F94_12830 [Bacillus sp. FJAT-27225]
MYCASCGMYLSAQERVCSNCGKSIYERPKHRHVPPAASDYENSFLIKKQMEETFIGRNYTYYRTRWNLLDKNNLKFSWNWAAFLLGPIWFGYRKMPVPVLAIIGMFIGLDVLSYLADYQNLYGQMFTVFFYFLGLSIWILLGLLGNFIYLKYAESLFAGFTENTMVPSEKRALLKKKGGTSCLGAFLVFVLLLTYFSVSLYFHF